MIFVADSPLLYRLVCRKHVPCVDRMNIRKPSKALKIRIFFMK